MDWSKFSVKAAKKVSSNLGVKKDHLQIIKQGSLQPIRTLDIMASREAIISMLYLCTSLYMGVQNNKQDPMLYKKGAQFIIDQYSWISVNELDLAFSLASARKIEVDLNAYYGTFSLEVVGKLLREYQRYRNKVLAAVEKEIEDKAKAEREEIEKDMKNQVAQAEFCKEVMKWVAMANEGFPPFDHWNEIPSVKSRAAFQAGALKVEAEQKKELWAKAGELAMKEIVSEKAAKVARGQLSSGNYKDFAKQIDQGYQPKGFGGKREKIYSQLLLWNFVKPKD